MAERSGPTALARFARKCRRRAERHGLAFLKRKAKESELIMKPLRAFLWASLGLGAACGDSQTGPGYQGEPLLEISGALVGQEITAQLVPAVAWLNPTDGDVYLQDVEVRGEFPNKFVLSVLDPVPESLRLDAAYYVGLDIPGDVAVGAIVVVSPDHPIETYHGGEFASDGGSMLESRSAWGYCSRDDDAEACWSEVTYCRRASLDAEEVCEAPVVEGDPVAAHVPYWYAQGVALDYELIYVSRDHPRGSFLSAVFNQYQPLKKGIHLVHYREPSPEEAAARDVCAGEAEARALARLNDAYGTHWTSELEFDLADPDEAQVRSYQAYHLEAFMDTACPYWDSPFVVEVVDDPARVPLQIRVGPGSEKQPFSIW
jgi:hypothetical protein